eukprot:6193275-Pleurochrysis_carterae.AAC.3
MLQLVDVCPYMFAFSVCMSVPAHPAYTFWMHEITKGDRERRVRDSESTRGSACGRGRGS